MLRTQPILYVARVVVETLSPLSIGSGRGAPLFDVRVVTDANGLPAIPGTSLTGVLRHAVHERHGEAAAQAIFGYVDGDEGNPSALSVTWGHIHNHADQPVDGPDLEHAWTRDALLKPFDRAALSHRDHVRLDHRGTGAERGKFDRSFVSAGHRFSFEMTLSDSPGGGRGEHWALLKSLLGGPGFRLGGATRRGYGQLRVVRIHSRKFDLRLEADFNAYSNHPGGLDQAHALPEEPPPADNAPEWLRLALELEPEDFWRFGGGSVPLTEGKPSDALPYTEERILGWPERNPAPCRHLVIPASGVKGALAHRLAYHYNRRAGRFADLDINPADEPFETEKNPALRALFGFAKDSDTDGQESGQAGVVLIDDAALPLQDARMWRMAHNSLDRFTGGVRDGVLFTEELAYRGAFPLRLWVKAKPWREADHIIRGAFLDAIDDLLAGHLTLGAAGAKGHGGFSGRIIHSDMEELAP